MSVTGIFRQPRAGSSCRRPTQAIASEARQQPEVLTTSPQKSNPAPPTETGAEGHECCRSKPEIIYCLSYTEVLWNSLPVGSVPLTVTVRLLPSAETTMRPVAIPLSPFLTVSSRVRSSIFFNDRMSEFGSPVTG